MARWRTKQRVVVLAADGRYRVGGLATQRIELRYSVEGEEFTYPNAVRVRAGRVLEGIDLRAR
jgi:hypothetical protein